MALSRRSFVATLGAAGIVPSATLSSSSAAMAKANPSFYPPANAPPDVASADHSSYLFFNSAEIAFIEPAVERLIPADENGPGALGAGVNNYLDKQLGGAWGAGERLYRSGPWQPGTPTQGYQLPFTPAELFRICLKSIDRQLGELNTPFHSMKLDVQDEYLGALEAGSLDLDGVPSAMFFDILLKMTIEGFFADPAYGGNRDMVAWRMIGFPGAYADYLESIDQHNVKFERAPMSLAQDAHGHIHARPNIPAHL